MVLTIADVEEFEDNQPDLPNGRQELDSEGEKFTIDLLSDGRNWHFFISPSTIEVIVPDENSFKMRIIRFVAERICRAISMMMQTHQFRKMMWEEPEHE